MELGQHVDLDGLPLNHCSQVSPQLVQPHPPTAKETIKNLHVATDQIAGRDGVDEQRHLHECEDPETDGQSDPQVLAAAFQYFSVRPQIAHVCVSRSASNRTTLVEAHW